MDRKVKIYIAAHKKANFPKEEIYIPIHVGAEGKEDLGYLKDNTGDNISNKNPNYCELTGTYWMLKNDDSDIIGLTHYRRYFFKKWNSNKLEDVLNKKDIEEILNQYDIIVPEKTKIIKYTVKQAYCKLHKPKDLEECRKILKEKYPEYLDSFDDVLSKKSFYACNMFITNKKIFNDYYNWLFDILFELENRIDISTYDDYNKRIYGFMSERLFNVWLKQNSKLKIKEVPVYNVDKSLSKQIIINKIKNIL